MNLCSRLLVLYCRSRPKDGKSRHFDPHFEKVRGGVERWCMARWKVRAEFLLRVIELHFLSLTVEALQGKMCQNLLPSGWVGHLEPKFQGEGVVPGEYFLVFTKLDTFCYPTVQTAPCYVRRFDTIPACDGRTDGQTDRRKDRQTDGIAVAITALAMQALRRAVKIHLSFSAIDVGKILQ